MVLKLYFLPVLFTTWSLFQVCGAQESTSSPDQYFGSSPDGNQEYTDWALSSTTQSRYKNSVFLGSNGDDNNTMGVAVHWTVTNETLSLAVAARTTGWVAFGLSENGGMFGSDVVAFEGKTPEVLRDLHILEDRDVLDDACNSWKLVDSFVLDDFLIFEATRAIDPQDSQDWPLLNDKENPVPATRIIAAWGDQETVSYHGDNQVRGAVRFYGSGESDQTTFEEAMQRSATGSFFIGASNHEILPIDTDYRDFCASASDVLSQTAFSDNAGKKLTIIGMEPVLDLNTVEFVHHFTVVSSQDGVTNSTLLCNAPDDEDDGFYNLVYVWAPGEDGFALPENVGLSYGPGDIQSLQLEIHYNNPSLVSGKTDNSGVRFYYTEEPREHELGILQLGDSFIDLYGLPVGEGSNEHLFECPGGCSSLVLDEPVTVIREYMHMHKTGLRMSNQQTRNGEVIREGKVSTFDFFQQGNQPVQQDPFEVRPGDGFSTRCTYNGDSDTMFGLGSGDEMCISFLAYYPAKKMIGPVPWTCSYGIDFVPECDAAWTQRALGSNDASRSFGLPPSDATCPSETNMSSGTSASVPFGSGYYLHLLSLVVSLVVSFNQS